MQGINHVFLFCEGDDDDLILDSLIQKEIEARVRGKRNVRFCVIFSTALLTFNKQTQVLFR